LKIKLTLGTLVETPGRIAYVRQIGFASIEDLDVDDPDDWECFGDMVEIKVPPLRRPVKATHAIQFDAAGQRVREIPLKTAVELQGNEIVETSLRVYREEAKVA